MDKKEAAGLQARLEALGGVTTQWVRPRDLQSAIAEFNSAESVEKKAEIFEYFLSCSNIDSFIVEPDRFYARSESQMARSRKFGGQDHHKIMIKGKELVIMERDVEPVPGSIRHTVSPWRKKVAINFSEITRVEKMPMVHNKYVLHIYT